MKRAQLLKENIQDKLNQSYTGLVANKVSTTNESPAFAEPING
jgi:hypothetical protein